MRTVAVAAMVPSREPRRDILRVIRAQSARRHLRSIRIVLNIFVILALLYTVTLTKQLLIPLVLASFIGLALNPIVARGAQWHIPRWLGASVLMIGLITGIGAGVGMLPVLAMGLAMFRGAKLAARWGEHRAIAGALLVIGLASLARL